MEIFIARREKCLMCNPSKLNFKRLCEFSWKIEKQNNICELLQGSSADNFSTTVFDVTYTYEYLPIQT